MNFKRMILVLCGALCLFLSSCNPGLLSGLYEIDALITGSGTESDPYLIRDQDDLLSIIPDLEDTYYALSSDITLSGDFTPIGSEEEPFLGSFDGQNHTISNLSIDDSSTDNVGFFAQIGDEDTAGSVSNLSIEISSITADTLVGGIAGTLYNGSIEYCSTTEGTITATGGDYVGGLVGYTEEYAAISYCYSTCDVVGTSSVGGLVGCLTGTDSFIEYSYSTGNVTADEYAGGIVGTLLIASGIGSESDISPEIRYCIAFNQNIYCSVDTYRVSGWSAGSEASYIYYCYAYEYTLIDGAYSSSSYSQDGTDLSYADFISSSVLPASWDDPWLANSNDEFDTRPTLFVDGSSVGDDTGELGF